MSDEKVAILIVIVGMIMAVAVAIWVIPEPTGDSSVYDRYVEDMQKVGRQPNGEPLGDAYQQEARKRMRDAGIWLEFER